MAMGEIGMFLPPESAYGTPGAYSQSLRAESTKRASYLSQMDQFYSSLEESKRQFEETMSFREESWEGEMSLKKSELALQRRLGIGQLLLGMYQAKSGRIAASRAGRTGGGSYLGRDKKLDFLRQMWREREKPEEKPSVPRYGSKYDPHEKSLSMDKYRSSYRREPDYGYPGYGL